MLLAEGQLVKESQWRLPRGRKSLKAKKMKAGEELGGLEAELEAWPVSMKRKAVCPVERHLGSLGRSREGEKSLIWIRPRQANEEEKEAEAARQAPQACVMRGGRLDWAAAGIC